MKALALAVVLLASSAAAAKQIRFEQATAGQVGLFLGAIGQHDVIVHADGKRDSLTLRRGDAREAETAFAKVYGLDFARAGNLWVVGSGARRALAVHALPRGQKVDLVFSDTSGDEIMHLVALIGRLELTGTLGGSFTLRVRGLDSGKVGNILLGLCGASVSPAGGKLTLGGSTCATSTAARPLPAPPGSDRAPDGVRIVMGGGDLKTITLVAISTLGKPQALVSDGREDQVLGVGVYLGAPEQLQGTEVRWKVTAIADDGLTLEPSAPVVPARRLTF